MEENKIAIISDIHANIEALKEVLKDIEKEGVNTIICLGDLVGYGPNPNEVVEAIKERAKIVIKGNHDDGIINSDILFNFNEYGIKAIEWQKRIIDFRNIDFLKQLENEKTFEEFQIVHGSLSDYYKYIMTIYDAIEEISFMKRDILFVGHTHRAVIFELEKGIYHSFKDGGDFILEKNKKYIINPGSVGQPRDFNPSSSYLIFYPKELRVKFKRINYPFYLTREKIISSGLPEFLGDRLIVGF